MNYDAFSKANNSAQEISPMGNRILKVQSRAKDTKGVPDIDAIAANPIDSMYISFNFVKAHVFCILH